MVEPNRMWNKSTILGISQLIFLIFINRHYYTAKRKVVEFDVNYSIQRAQGPVVNACMQAVRFCCDVRFYQTKIC
jgi:hypothetical protein